MALTITFFISGVAIALMLFTKRVEMEHKRTFILLRAISRGDERVRSWAHRSAHLYSEGKEKASFFLVKQLPIRTRNLWNKTSSQAGELGAVYLDKIRGARILKSTDEGLSDFFRNLSSRESEEEKKGEEDAVEQGSQKDKDIVR
ncbi:MAG: hypothetical protein WDZ61_00915 [Parcubacteria group bacterium]